MILRPPTELYASSNRLMNLLWYQPFVPYISRMWWRQEHAAQVPFDSCASAMKGVLRELGAAAVSATGVTVTGEEVSDSCLTVAAAASKAIMCA